MKEKVTNMKTSITIMAAAVAMTMTATSADAFFNNHKKGSAPEANAEAAAKANANATAIAVGKGGNASARQGQHQGQAQGQIQGQAQSNTQNTTVTVDTPAFTYGAHLGLSTTANWECDRVLLGLIPMNGQNCKDMAESAKMGSIVERMNSKDPAVRAGAKAELTMWVSEDASARRAARILGLIK